MKALNVGQWLSGLRSRRLFVIATLPVPGDGIDEGLVVGSTLVRARAVMSRAFWRPGGVVCGLMVSGGL